jgi:hypothetical protein
MLDSEGHIKLKMCKEGVIFTTKTFHKMPEYMAPEVCVAITSIPSHR